MILTLQVISRYPRLVACLHGPLALEALKEPTDQPVRDLAKFRRLIARPEDPGHELPLAVIERHERSTLLHDRPPFACGSVPCPEHWPILPGLGTGKGPGPSFRTLRAATWRPC